MARMFESQVQFHRVQSSVFSTFLPAPLGVQNFLDSSKGVERLRSAKTTVKAAGLADLAIIAVKARRVSSDSAAFRTWLTSSWSLGRSTAVATSLDGGKVALEEVARVAAELEGGGRGVPKVSWVCV